MKLFSGVVFLTGSRLTLMAVRSAPAEPKEDCTWGASSVIVEQVNGEYVPSEPVTTGCIPTAP